MWLFFREGLYFWQDLNSRWTSIMVNWKVFGSEGSFQFLKDVLFNFVLICSTTYVQFLTIFFFFTIFFQLFFSQAQDLHLSIVISKPQKEISQNSIIGLQITNTKLVTPFFRFPKNVLVVYLLTDKSRLVCHHKFGVCSVESVNVKLWLKKKGRGPFNNYVEKMR